MNSLLFVITLVGLVTAILNIPLVLGRIGPNRFYGFRTRTAFSSEENWYRINKFGGKIFFCASCFITLIGLAGFFVPLAFLAIYCVVAAPLVLASILGSVGIVLIGS